MNYTKLVPIREEMHMDFPYFPNRMYAAIFRLWETVTVEQIAKGLDLPLEVVLEAANNMGLPEQKNMSEWASRGYITTIRNAWHILPYEQLLKVLDWDEDQLAVVLKEDDFLDIKLGSYKPYCETIKYEPLTAIQQEMADKIKAVMQSEFSDMFLGDVPFEFFKDNNIITFENNDQDGGVKMIFSYCGLYGSVLENDIEISYPEELLKSYKSVGVNAVWLPVVLYQVTPFPFDESYSVGWEKRQERLRKLISLAGKYGIKVYLYLNEPRSMPLKFFEKHPELKGYTTDMYASLCSSRPEVLEYLRNAVKNLCKAVPGLGGFFTITVSENLTNCKSRNENEPCPRCKNTPVDEIVSDIIRTMYEASHEVDPNIKNIAWTWAWQHMMTDEEAKACIDKIPKEVIIASVSETNKKFNISGVEGRVFDYSMSIPGPSDYSKDLWQYARDRGHEVAAKVQVNVTWECSTLPYLPVFDLIREHMKGLRDVGVEHLMLSWTLGGYPSINLKVASECLNDPSEEKYDRLLAAEFGEYADKVKRATKKFSDAFREFPFSLRNIYFGPQSAGPATIMYEKPSGFEATMTCYAYDDIDLWRDNYPREIYRDQLEKERILWREGLKEIEDMPDCEFKDMAYGGYALFNSSFLQTEFILCREGNDVAKIVDVLSEERSMAKLMYNLMNRNSSIGFEAANHYYFNKGIMAEKAICCDYLIDRFKTR